MPRYKYAGLDLGQVLSRHGDDLATQTDIGWLSFDAKKVIRVKLAGPGQGGFLHPHKSVTLFGAQLFDSKSDAEDDALAKLLHNTAHTGQLSTLPPERRAAVETRYDEIQKWTENEKPKKKTGAHQGSGKGYRVDSKRGGGTQLTLKLTFTPLPDFTAEDCSNRYKKGLKAGDRLKDTQSNRDKIEAAHSENPSVQRRKKLANAPKPDQKAAQRKFGGDISNSSSESSPEASRPPARLKRMPALKRKGTRRAKIHVP